MELLSNKGVKLSKIHLSSSKTIQEYAYFKSKRYNKMSKNIKEFLVEYAKDSGKIPACN